MYRTLALLSTCRTWQQRAAETIGPRLNHKTLAHTSIHASPSINKNNNNNNNNSSSSSSSSSTKPLENGSLGVTVTVREKSEALKYAHSISGKTAEASAADLVLWSDASSLYNRPGAHTCAIVLKARGSSSWGFMTRALPFAKTDMAELYAILLALKVAMQHVKDKKPQLAAAITAGSTTAAAATVAAAAAAARAKSKGNAKVKVKGNAKAKVKVKVEAEVKVRVEAKDGPSCIKIFSDSQTSLEWISAELAQAKIAGKEKKYVVRNIVLQHIGLMSRQLGRLGISLELHWVPRGSVLEHILADKAARLARLGFLNPDAWNKEEAWASLIKGKKKQLMDDG